MNVVHVICKLFNVDAMYYTHALSYCGKKQKISLKNFYYVFVLQTFTSIVICHRFRANLASVLKKYSELPKRKVLKDHGYLPNHFLPFHPSFVVFYLGIGTFRVFLEHCQIFKTSLNELINF